MPTDMRESRLARRIADLYAHDPQFAAARPDASISEAINQPGLRLAQVMANAMEGYADRPALGQRVVQVVTDPATGRTSIQPLPRFETISYRELWERVGACAGALTDNAVSAADRVCVLGFTGIDYTTIELALLRLGAVAVPLPSGTAANQLSPIVAETEPTVIASSIEQLAVGVELALASPPTKLLVVFDYRLEVDDHNDAIQSARSRVADAGSRVVIDTLSGLIERGRTQSAPSIVPDGEDPLTMLMYTSGSTGAPKGVMYTERRVRSYWLRTGWSAWDPRQCEPAITLNFLPMSHDMARGTLYPTLARGGIAFFAATSDLSTLLEDLGLVRPTQLIFVPRIWEMLFQEFQGALDRRTDDGAGLADVENRVVAEQREQVLGGRFLSALTGSAPMSPEMHAFVESYIDMHLIDCLGCTEAGVIFKDAHILRPPVVDYKLVDVPELGYFRTDRPHPRGELALKTASMFPGYYRRPDVTAETFDSDGYYLTGDVVAEIGPDQLVYVDRRKFVQKLSQGEFVAISKLEAAYGVSPLIRQIYVYGNSARPYLLAVIVPTDDALSAAGGDLKSLKARITDSVQKVAKDVGLQPYEIPRDFILETTPFTVENGLLTGVRKLARPQLRERYGERLEGVYNELAERQTQTLRDLRRNNANRPILERLGRAATALLGATNSNVRPDSHFTDLGGDSLSALTFANLIRDILDVDVPVGVIVSPASDLQSLAYYIEAQQAAGNNRPTFATVHGEHAREVSARDLALEKFIDAATLTGARALPRPGSEIRTVFLTGATGFLGRFLALEWLRRLSPVGGKLICLVRGRDDVDARNRLDAAFDNGDADLLAHYRELAKDHLEVLSGDKSAAYLGLDQGAWQRLAESVDLVVDPAALVNHVLPYTELFGPNVVGTAELLRLAMTTKLKPYTYVSTVGVGDQIAPSEFTEHADIRVVSAHRKVDDSYANGYDNSKWASEVLLREAKDLCGLPVAVFRCDLLMTNTHYAGQLNLPDMLTRLLFSLVATGIAPASFYELDADGNRQRAHFDGLPVDFVAEAITTLGGRVSTGYETYHVMNPHDDGIGLDQYVDWLIDNGYAIQRITDYSSWLQRFETAMRALPHRERQLSLLPLMHNYQRPLEPLNSAMAPTEHFRSAVHDAKVGAGEGIPHVAAPMIIQYVADLQSLGLL